MVHNLKIDFDYFSDVVQGDKTFEIRFDDRPYEEGDYLFLREYDPSEGFTGEYCVVMVTYVFGREEHEKDYVRDGFVTLGIQLFELNGRFTNNTNSGRKE